jgi:hypothetical protein
LIVAFLGSEKNLIFVVVFWYEGRRVIKLIQVWAVQIRGVGSARQEEHGRGSMGDFSLPLVRCKDEC